MNELLVMKQSKSAHTQVDVQTKELLISLLMLVYVSVIYSVVTLALDSQKEAEVTEKPMFLCKQ